MKKNLPTQSQGHLIVAAIRVLLHRDARPPTEVAVAELLCLPPEGVGHMARGLQSVGAIRIVQSAFDIRLELVDHERLTELPTDDETDKLKDEVDAFHERKKQEHTSIDTLFGEDPTAKKKSRLTKMEEELKKFQKGGKGAPPPWESSDEE